VSGFRYRQRKTAETLHPDDLFVCYLVRLSRWCGLLRVLSGPYNDATPIFSDPDPFSVRFRVDSLIALDLEHSIPIDDDEVWPRLSLTRGMERRAAHWAQAANLRASLRELPVEDGELLASLLNRQGTGPRQYPLTPADDRRLSQRQAVRTPDRLVVVEVPAKEDLSGPEAERVPADGYVRESYQIQAALARIGSEMGFRIWIPRGDRQQVAQLLAEDARSNLITDLPLNYNDTTLRTIEQIDVIWLRNRAMARAFEVEHTTTIYSGLLRMADLLALQPNMDIRLHIVAPDDRREKVLQELQRPVFALLEKGPLYESCTFLPYSAVRQIAEIPHLQHMRTGSIVEEYEEMAQDE
jgi:hypothetical protein